jgi:hypothetical protein
LLETSSLPPMRRARSRMPIMPQWPSRCSVPQYIRHDAAAVVPAMKAEAFRSIYEVQNDVGCASVTDRVGECFTPDPVKLVAYGCAKWLCFSGDGYRDLCIGFVLQRKCRKDALHVVLHGFFRDVELISRDLV